MLQRPDLFVITTGNPKVGLGHVNRCTSLSYNVSQYFNRICFVFNQSDDSLQFDHYPCVYSSDRALYVLQHSKPGDHVILDDYALTEEDVHPLQAHGLWTIGINDIPADALPCNVIINHLPAAEKKWFSHLSNPRLLLGSAYLMLRKPFLDALKNHRKTSPQSGLIIALGGTDPEQLTEKFLHAAIALNIAPVHIVTSHLNNRLPELKKRCNETVHLHIGLNADEMVALMQSCKFSVLTASTLTLEAMCVGSCMATGYTHENQKMIAATCEKHQTALNAGDLHTANALDVLSQLILMNADELKTNQYNLMKDADPENFKDLLKESF